MNILPLKASREDWLSTCHNTHGHGWDREPQVNEQMAGIGETALLPHPLSACPAADQEAVESGTCQSQNTGPGVALAALSRLRSREAQSLEGTKPQATSAHTGTVSSLPRTHLATSP